MVVKEGKILLGANIDAFLWTIWREFSNLSPIRKVGNFYHLQPEEIESYDSFAAIIKKYEKKL